MVIVFVSLCIYVWFITYQFVYIFAVLSPMSVHVFVRYLLNLSVCVHIHGVVIEFVRGWNSSVGSVLGWLSCLMQRSRFESPLSLW